MYLSRIKLDYSNNSIKQCLRNVQDMHRSIMNMFKCTRKEAKVLYRVADDAMQVYLLSDRVPEQTTKGMEIQGTVSMDRIYRNIHKDSVLAFDLVTSPCKKIREEGVNNSRRRFIQTKEGREDWLKKKGMDEGFIITQLYEEKKPTIYGTHKAEHGGEMKCAVVHFEGTLKVYDEERFINALSNGIGPGKAYGLGMILLKGVR